MTELWGTITERWYVLVLAAVFGWAALRDLGLRKTLLFSVVAFLVGGTAENTSVHWGLPYTSYSFNEEFRGDELWFFDVPLFVPLSYFFSVYFAFASARLILSGPWRTRMPGATGQEYVLAVVLAVWPVWLIDPMSRLGGTYLGRVFTYDGPGFWFGLPFASQTGYTIVTGSLLVLLFWLKRDDPDVPVPGGLLRHPRAISLLTWHGTWVHMVIVALLANADTLGGSAILIYVPALVLTWIMWSRTRPPVATVSEPREKVAQ
ncbi:carotenoid biosynthesis protein [Actinocorallia sp. A-T 12471]|uniref:carotenoid biosynthesis protein n=1 Tax=Actinocorallia sp. A-T 12471 TaxID=3089813 RepID=UPI0029CF9E62|nr:carotenoid biosynthesis protein [Actinocorallia sp. A-T 12471]MDX6741472.1 carotenoid biosynthesis protein [Actinocorallia sp. A-T 12471]